MGLWIAVHDQVLKKIILLLVYTLHSVNRSPWIFQSDSAVLTKLSICTGIRHDTPASEQYWMIFASDKWFVCCYHTVPVTSKVHACNAWWRHDMENFSAFVSLLGFLSERASKAKLWCFLCRKPKPAFEQTIDMSMAWDTMTLTWRHFTGFI